MAARLYVEVIRFRSASAYCAQSAGVQIAHSSLFQCGSWNRGSGGAGRLTTGGGGGGGAGFTTGRAGSSGFAANGAVATTGHPTPTLRRQDAHGYGAPTQTTQRGIPRRWGVLRRLDAMSHRK